MRRKKKKSDSHSVPHIDEKWLVSYSDMMTLLFGLFVMLYSFGLKNKGGGEAVQNELKKVAQKGFNAAAVDEKLKDVDNETLKKVIINLQQEIVKLNEKVTAAQSESSVRSLEESRMKSEIESLRAQNLAQAKQMERMPAAVKVADSKGGTSVSTVVMVYVRWMNRNHDIDLMVRTPDNQQLDFKNRKLADGDADEFVTDSKSGPGVEMFKSVQPKAGSYAFEISLYNSRGDVTPSEVVLYATVNGQEKVLEKFILKDDETERSRTIQVDLKNLVP